MQQPKHQINTYTSIYMGTLCTRKYYSRRQITRIKQGFADYRTQSAEGNFRLGACLSISRGRDRGRFPLRQGGADEVGSRPNEEATTPHEGKSARSRRVGKERCVCGVARLVHSTHYRL